MYPEWVRDVSTSQTHSSFFGEEFSFGKFLFTTLCFEIEIELVQAIALQACILLGDVIRRGLRVVKVEIF
jgi:hypothetical protein